MKRLLMMLLLLSTTLSFASSDFKDGFLEGVKTCSSVNLVSCSVEFQDSLHPSHPLETRVKIAEGYTRGQALSRLIEVCEKSAYKYKCLEAVRGGLSTCKNL